MKTDLKLNIAGAIIGVIGFLILVFAAGNIWIALGVYVMLFGHNLEKNHK